MRIFESQFLYKDPFRFSSWPKSNTQIPLDIRTLHSYSTLVLYTHIWRSTLRIALTINTPYRHLPHPNILKQLLVTETMSREFVNGIPPLRVNRRQNEVGHGFEEPGTCHCQCRRLAELSVDDYSRQLGTEGVPGPMGEVRLRLIAACQAIIHNIHRTHAFQTWRPSRAILQTRDYEVGVWLDLCTTGA